MSQHTRSSLIHKQVELAFSQVSELSLSSYLWLRWVQLKLILEEGESIISMVVRASSWHISYSSSAVVLLCHLHHVWKAFTAQFVFHFIFTGKIWLLSPLDIFCFSLLKRFESLTNDRDSLFLFFVFIAFVSFSSKSLSLSLHPTGANRFRETRKQLTTFFPFQLDSA